MHLGRTRIRGSQFRALDSLFRMWFEYIVCLVGMGQSGSSRFSAGGYINHGYVTIEPSNQTQSSMFVLGYSFLSWRFRHISFIFRFSCPVACTPHCLYNLCLASNVCIVAYMSCVYQCANTKRKQIDYFRFVCVFKNVAVFSCSFLWF